MRILHIMASRGNGGAETYFADLALALAKAGIEQYAICPVQQPRFIDLNAAGVHMHPEALAWPLTKRLELATPDFRFMIPQAPGFLQRKAIMALAHRVQPTLIHSWMRRGAELAPSLPGVPLIGWFGGYYDVKYFRRCTHCIGVTADIAEHIKRSGFPADRVFVQTTFAAIDTSVVPVDRAAFDTPRDATLLLALSRLHPKKGLDILLQALRDLPDCYAWIAGDGPLETILKAQAHELGVEKRVRFLGWRTDSAALINAADIVVMPSRYEPFGTVVLEAWAGKKPIIAAAAVGPAATITEGVDGLVVPIDDAPAFRQAVRFVIDNPEAAKQMAGAGHKKHATAYSPEASTQRMIGLYRQISENKNVPLPLGGEVR